MVGDSKILTVSYGTFSCTLEGFDDPFSTMKAIAEYFRDLAAGDRFFGAEPPQPDTDLLHKIAEETIKRQVNAEVSGDSLILRQAETSTPQPERVAAPVAAAITAPSHASDGEAPLSSVAEKLKRIRAVVANEAARNLAFDEDQHADTFDAQPVEIEHAAQNETSELEAQADEEPEPEFDVSAFVANDESLQETPEEIEDTPAEVEDSLEDDFEEDAEIEDNAEERASEAEAAEELIASEDDFETEDEDKTAEARFLPEAEEETLEAEDEANDASDTVGDLDEFEEEAVAETLETEELEADPFEKFEEEFEAEVDEVTDLSDETVTETDDVEMDEETSEIEEISDDLDEVTEEDAPKRLDVLTLVNPINAADFADNNDEIQDELSEELDAEDDDAEDHPKPRVVVQRISRADILANLSEEVASEANADDAEETLDIEAELARELNAIDEIDSDVENEALDDSEMAALQSMLAESAQAEADDARQARIDRRSKQPFEDGEAALSRLMDETSKIEDDDEGTIRRASIAHLKAAVAATKADSSIAEAAAAEDERELDQYREDLARVVRPGRARKREDGEKRSRPEAMSSGPQPLMLVGDQRVEADEEQAAAKSNVASVQPRRISANELALQEDESQQDEAAQISDDVLSFAEYADAMEATDLPDVLEAAAAHTIYIEGLSSFTRPMLMRKMETVNADGTHSRETILRSFGTLLRQGKLVKNKNGNFVIAKSSRFTPEARYAGE